MRPLTLATAERKDSRTWAQHEVTWAEFLERTADPADRKECGQYVFGALNGNRRNRDSIIHRDAVTLDADAAGPRLPEQVAALGYAALVHSTYSSSEDQPRYRVVIPTDRPVTPDEYRALAAQLIAELGADQFDPGSTQPERYMFWPAAREPELYEHHVYEGPLLAVDLELAETCREATEKERTESAGGLVTPQHRAAAKNNLYKGEAQLALGSRNNTVREWLLVIASNAKAGAIDWEWAREHMWQAASAIPVATEKDAYTRAEFEATCDGAWKDARPELPTGVSTPADDFTAWTEPDPDPADALALEIERLRREDERKALTAEARRWLDNGGKPPAAPYAPLDLVHLMDPERPAREWVVEGLMFAGTATALVAPAGTRKSLIALRIALAVARGEADFAGMPIPKRRRVFYIDKENPEDEQHDRLKSFGLTQPDAEALAGWLYLVPFPNAAPLDTRHGGDQLMAALDAYDLGQGDVVFIDSFQRVTEGESNDDTTIRHYTQFTGDRLKAKGVTVVRLDNTGKNEALGARGSKGKSDDVDFEYQLSKVYESHDRAEVETKVLKDRTGAVGSVPTITVTRQDGVTTFTQREAPTEQDKVQQCVTWMDTHDLPGDWGVNKAWAWTRDNQPEPGYFKRDAHVRPAVEFRQQRGGDFNAE